MDLLLIRSIQNCLVIFSKFIDVDSITMNMDLRLIPQISECWPKNSPGKRDRTYIF
jgi:hypothetical protein